MVVVIDELLWLQWNIDHIWEKHGVKMEEVVQSLNDLNLIVIPAKQRRIMVLGRAGTRLLSTILNKKEENTYYVITSRDMSKRERVLYSSQRGML